MKDTLRRIYAFNLYQRDEWVAFQANLVPAGSKVLDVGAGSCPYRALFSHCDYKSHDFVALSPDQLRGQHGYGAIDYVSDIANIPVSDSEFDVILCTEVLEHIPEPILAIREFARILKPGGRLLLSAPLGSGLHQEPYHFYGGYTPYWYKHFLPAAGFRDITIDANGGFFKLYGQESIRFSMMLRSVFTSGFDRWLLWMFWALTLPVYRVATPILCHLLDHLDKQRQFTVGYHVVATRI